MTPPGRSGTFPPGCAPANWWDSKLVEVPTANHPGILSAQATIDAVVALAKAR